LDHLIEKKKWKGIEKFPGEKRISKGGGIPEKKEMPAFFKQENRRGDCGGWGLGGERRLWKSAGEKGVKAILTEKGRLVGRRPKNLGAVCILKKFAGRKERSPKVTTK